MITFTGAQLTAWIALLFYPLVRVLAFFAIVPLFSNISAPVRVRLLTGIAVTIGILPLIPAPPPIDVNSGTGLWMIAREMSVGLAMGLAMRIVFAAFIMAGEQIGFQMGIGFATFYSPQNAAQTPILAEYFSLLSTLIFLSMNGHLMLLATLAQSFQAIPISPQPLPAENWSALTLFGSKIFSAGLLFALPVTVALVITNLALGVLAKASPQLNLFAIGFPITLVVGFLILSASLSHLLPPTMQLFEEGLRMMLAPGGVSVPPRP
jgi:flagellar biosynthetic protein FliR